MDIPLDTTLKTSRLSLRPVDFCDVELAWQASRVAGFNDGMTWDPPASRQELVQITQRNLDHWREGTNYVFTVCTQNPALAVGRVGLYRETDPDTWNLGFWIHPDHWGNAYAPEAARSVLEFGFDTLKAARVVTEHATWNKRSQSVIRGLGFEYVRENPAGFYKNGNPVSVREYEMGAPLVGT